MKDIINNIISVYQMQANALGVLLANTQKALEQSEKKERLMSRYKGWKIL
jgi:hypothetical protein